MEVHGFGRGLDFTKKNCQQDFISKVTAEYLATSPQVILMFPGKQKGFYSNTGDYLCWYTFCSCC